MTINVGFRVVHCIAMQPSNALPHLAPPFVHEAGKPREDRNFLNFTLAGKPGFSRRILGNPPFPNRNFLNFTSNQMVVSK
ncbi:hypothetical protein [Sphingomonas xinjiangensis]|uniref:Uncharacterized protein n=1 Tax=Sphingomonas xinjiangensis TaxID=643568 RepID=A0A840YKH4_9SPHN|nr:hypothetical protein [Sphingomonas xinjiangensis]MBB5709510.1 hypothetical protein [Sphingomonas xinjiangensis]